MVGYWWVNGGLISDSFGQLLPVAWRGGWFFCLSRCNSISCLSFLFASNSFLLPCPVCWTTHVVALLRLDHLNRATDLATQVLSLKAETRLHLVLRSPWPAFRMLDLLARLIPQSFGERSDGPWVDPQPGAWDLESWRKWVGNFIGGTDRQYWMDFAARKASTGE